MGFNLSLDVTSSLIFYLLLFLMRRGRGCADANFPGVYSRMSYFYDWIVETACKESDHAPPSFNCQRQAASTTKAPTDAPTDEPTSAPTSPPTKTPNGSFGFRSIPQLDYLGWNPSSSYPLALCQGDCDADDQVSIHFHVSFC